MLCARMAMAWQDDLNLHFLGAGHGGVEVPDFKPEQHAISVWLGLWISDGAVMMLHFPPVQLQNQLAVRYQPLILNAAMRALTTQEPLIPAAAGLHVAHANQGL